MGQFGTRTGGIRSLLSTKEQVFAYEGVDGGADCKWDVECLLPLRATLGLSLFFPPSRVFLGVFALVLGDDLEEGEQVLHGDFLPGVRVFIVGRRALFSGWVVACFGEVS